MLKTGVPKEPCSYVPAPMMKTYSIVPQHVEYTIAHFLATYICKSWTMQLVMPFFFAFLPHTHGAWMIGWYGW